MPKKENVRQMFDSIAPDYDRLNHLMSLNVDKGWRRKALKRIVDTDGPLEVLDLACGIPSRLDYTCRDTAVGCSLCEHLLLLDWTIQVRTHHELLSRILTKLYFTSLCNYFNRHNV